MKNWIKGTLVAGVTAAGILGLSACEVEESSQSKESDRRQGSYDTLTQNQPAKEMEHSPTRKTVNKWVETWGTDPNKLAYVYIQNGNGDYGYFVMEGPPVSMCVMLSPNYEIEGNSWGNVVVPAPGMDGAYYGGEGSCDTYYGFDAESGAYLEFTVGMNQSYFLFDQPMDLPGDLVPMGDAEL